MTWLRRSLGHASPADRSRYHEQAAAVIDAHPERAAELLPADPVEAAYVQSGRRYRQLLAELQQRAGETPS